MTTPEPEPERSCRVCGCTDMRGCIPPCWWVESDLCSACFAANKTELDADS